MSEIVKCKRYRVKKRKFILFVVILGIITGTVYATQQYIKRDSKSNKNVTVEAKKVIVKNKVKDNKNKALDKDKVKGVGIKNKDSKYAYDAKKIQEKLTKTQYFNNGEKVVFLTFDDGSSTTVTPKILKILQQENVKATFFLIGSTIESGGTRARQLVKEIFNSGHAIGNHSYSHKYSILYPNRSLNLEAFKQDFKKTDKILKDILGQNFSTRVIRCPGGYMSWKNMKPLEEYLNKTNRAYIDWNALTKDGEGRWKNANQLVNEGAKTSRGKNLVVMLMHDTYGKEQTVKALPQVIKYFRDKGYKFKILR